VFYLHGKVSELCYFAVCPLAPDTDTDTAKYQAFAVFYFIGKHGKGLFPVTAKDLIAYTAKALQFQYPATTIQKGSKT
jgi:hypothetical protein